MRLCVSSSFNNGICFRASVGKWFIHINIITRFITINCATSKIEPLRLVDVCMVDTRFILLLLLILLFFLFIFSFTQQTTFTHSHTCTRIKARARPRLTPHDSPIYNKYFVLFYYYFCFSLFYFSLWKFFLMRLPLCQLCSLPFSVSKEKSTEGKKETNTTCQLSVVSFANRGFFVFSLFSLNLKMCVRVCVFGWILKRFSYYFCLFSRSGFSSSFWFCRSCYDVDFYFLFISVDYFWEPAKMKPWNE